MSPRSAFTLAGEYKWSLMFSYDNTSSPLTVHRTITCKNRTHVSNKSFKEAIHNVDSSVNFNMEIGASATFMGVDVEDKTSFGLAQRVYDTYTEQLTKDIDTTIEEEYELTLDVGPGSHIQLYSLRFVGPGVDVDFGQLRTAIIEIGTPLPPVDTVTIGVEICPPLYTWHRMRTGDKMPEGAYTCESPMVLCRAVAGGELKPGFVNPGTGRAEIAVGDCRVLVDTYEVLTLTAAARAYLIDNAPPHTTNNPPDHLLIVGPGYYPVCRSQHNGDERPAFVNKQYAEVAWGDNRYLHEDFQWVCINRA